MRTVVAKWQAMGFRVASVNVLSLALVISALWFLGNPDQVHACKCAVPGSPSEEFEKFSAVFAGKVISIHHSFDLNAATVSPEDRTTVGFLVSTVWKGTIYEDMYITTPPTGGSCGFSFTNGEEYIVYAHDSAYADGSGYTVSICSRSALLGQAQVDIDALGAGRAPQAGTGGTPQAWTGDAPQAGTGSATQTETSGATQAETGGPLPEQPQNTVVSTAWVIVLAVAAAVLVIGGAVVYARVRRR